MTLGIHITFGDTPTAHQAGWLTLSTEMPPLVGSPKQIAWSEDIRARMAKELAEFVAKGFKITVGAVLQSDTAFIAETDAKLATALATPNAQPALRAIEKLFAQASAKYWIDNRNRSAVLLAEEIART